MSWDARSLETVVLSNGDTVYYTYNSSGIRTQKRIVSSTGAVTTHDYLLDGTNILKETVSGAENYVLEYLYDESGVAGIKYNGSALYFIKNLQGDVIALTDDSSIKLVQYTYDAWGNVISITGSLASLLGNINPIRYRGYYYDIDTGYYYLNSRYYDPTVGRFLNGDAFIGINGGIQGYNMYAYCNNSPVAFADSTGTVMMPNILPDEPEPPKLPAKPSRPKPSIEKSVEPEESVNNCFDEIKQNSEGNYGTFTLAQNLSLSICGISISGQVGVSADLDGNVALQPTIAIDTSSNKAPSWSFTTNHTITNAPDVFMLEGIGYQVGGSVGVNIYNIPAYADANINFIPDSDSNDVYKGFSTSVGLGSSGVEVHSGASYTPETKYYFNIWDKFSNAWEEVKSWF